MRERRIRVLLGAQRLEVWEDGRIIAEYSVSTSMYGSGELQGSEKTPRGLHEISEKIGAGQPRGSVFIGRRATGEICQPDLVNAQPGRDWILSRILSLRGLELKPQRAGR